MKKVANYREASFGPLQQKTFRAALELFFAKELPHLGGPAIRQEVSKRLEELVNNFFPRHTHLRMGQVMWPAVEETECASYGKRLAETKVRPVFLDLISDDDIKDYLKGESMRSVKQKASVRLFQQAKKQGGVLTCVDVATMLKMAAGTISNYVRSWEKEHHVQIPRRGTIHDMGPSLTHKREICYKHLFEGKSVEQVERETNHTPEAITRYVSDFKRIDACFKAGLSIEQTAYATKHSPRLVNEYKNLMDDYKQLHSASEDDQNVPF